MVFEDKSVNGSTVPDAVDDALQSITVPAGELWYVETIYGTSDGGGTDATFKIGLGVGQTAELDAANSLSGVSRGANANMDMTVQAGRTGTVGAYAIAGEEIRVAENSDGGGGGTAYYTVTIRRIL